MDRLVFLLIGVGGAVAHGFGLVCAMDALLKTRTSQGAIAWIVSLITIPYLAVPFYWVFGRRKYHGYVRQRRSGAHETGPLTRGLQSHAPRFRAELRGRAASFQVLERLARMPFTHGNAARLFTDGAAAFRTIFGEIEAATNYVLVQFFIVEDDDLGRELKGLLARRARAGVRIFFLYDEVGSRDLPKAYVRELRAAGVDMRDFHTTRGRSNRFQLNFRNHRKIVVVDGPLSAFDRRAQRGPMNTWAASKRFGRWRDTHVRVEGPAVQCVQVAFARRTGTGPGAGAALDTRAGSRARRKGRPCSRGPADGIRPTSSRPAACSSCRPSCMPRSGGSGSASPYFVPD